MMATPDQFVQARTNEMTLHRFVDEVINQRGWHLMDNLLTEDVTFTTPRTAVCGREKVKWAIREGVEAFDGLSAAINHVIVDDKCAAVRFTVHAVHTHSFAGIRPTHRRIAVPMVYIVEFTDGCIRSLETFYDLQVLLSEIGSGSTQFLR